MTFLKWLWSKWLPIAKIVGNFNAQVLLTIFYLIFLLPLGIAYRFFNDSLGFKLANANHKSNFRKWVHQKQNLNDARKQY